jgi:hypothetical protein
MPPPSQPPLSSGNAAMRPMGRRSITVVKNVTLSSVALPAVARGPRVNWSAQRPLGLLRFKLGYPSPKGSNSHCCALLRTADSVLYCPTQLPTYALLRGLRRLQMRISHRDTHNTSIASCHSRLVDLIDPRIYELEKGRDRWVPTGRIHHLSHTALA